MSLQLPAWLQQSKRWLISRFVRSEWRPPPAPSQLLSDHSGNRARLHTLYQNAPVRDPREDDPLHAAYRIYAAIILDDTRIYRNEIEYFWWRSGWRVQDIPDPKDSDPERYACLAGVTGILCVAFNGRMETLKVNRKAPPIMYEDRSKYAVTEDDIEHQPQWAVDLPPLPTALKIPYRDQQKGTLAYLSDEERDREEESFAEKNISLWKPHIHFV